jgi:predicted DCC family thiol-disulfide oxidoreductase YuxK
MDHVAGRVEVFFDGECPLCRREIAMLRRMDRKHAVGFIDIAEPGFEPKDHGLEVDHAALMARIHGRRANGELIEGVEVFRELYAAVGLRRLAAFSRLPGIAWLAELGYRIFAKNRLRLPFRAKHECDSDRCVRVA